MLGAARAVRDRHQRVVQFFWQKGRGAHTFGESMQHLGPSRSWQGGRKNDAATAEHGVETQQSVDFRCHVAVIGMRLIDHQYLSGKAEHWAEAVSAASAVSSPGAVAAAAKILPRKSVFSMARP